MSGLMLLDCRAEARIEKPRRPLSPAPIPVRHRGGRINPPYIPGLR
jgi:hypothetical protein